MKDKCEHFDMLYPTEPGTVRADGFAGHFVASHHCHFRLHHHILSESGKRYRVSTVGNYAPSRQRHMTDVKYQTMGTSGKHFELMVFEEYINENGYLDMNGQEIASLFTDDSIEATRMHYIAVVDWVER